MKSRNLMIIMVVLILLLNIFDAYITLWFINKGIAEEYNPIAGFLIKHLGKYFILLKASFSILVGMLLIKSREYKTSWYVSILVLTVYGVVALYHLSILLLYG